MAIKKLQRKAAPFLQAMSDLRYCAAENRRKMIIDELFADKGKDYIETISNPYHQKDLWLFFLFV